MNLYLLLLIFILGLIGAFIDSAFKMGYGLLTPILILLNFTPLTIIPILLLAQMIAGFSKTIYYYFYSGVDYAELKREVKINTLFIFFGLISALFGIIIVFILPEIILIIYIAISAIIGGIIILSNIKFHYKAKRLYFLSSLSSFNQAISAAGYGPIASYKQFLKENSFDKNEAVTYFLEAMISGFAFLFYFIFFNESFISEIELIVILVISAIISTPLGALSKRYVKKITGIKVIGLISIILGIILLGKIVFIDFLKII